MTGLRQSKKEATRRAIADAAAYTILNEDPEAFTVARVASRAEISPRTFHNYFASLDDALLSFVQETITDAAENISIYPQNMGTVEVIEKTVLSAVEQGNSSIRNLLNVIRLGDVLNSRNHKPETKTSPNEVLLPLISALAKRNPNTERFTIEVQFSVAAAAGITALRSVQLLDNADVDKRCALVKEAFRVLRDI